MKMTLEKENFKIDSKNREIKTMDWWQPYIKDEIKIKMNPENDIIEYVSWVSENMVWEQLFTYNAAIRETTKYNKKIPTISDIKEIVDIEDSEWVRFIWGTKWDKVIIKWNNLVDIINLKSSWLCSFFEWKHTFWNIDNFDYRWLIDKKVVCIREDMYDFWDFWTFSWIDWNTWYCSVRCLK